MKLRQKEDNCCMIPCMWHLKCDTDEFVCDTETDSDRRTDVQPRRSAGGEGLGFRVSRCKPARTGWTGTMVLPHSTGSSFNIR